MAATIRDVSRLAGVSISTVSKYINGGNLRDKNTEKIKRAIEELNYQPNVIAQSLKSSRTKTVGILMPSLSNLFCGIIVSGLEKELQRQGYGVILCDCNNNPEAEMQCAEFLLQKQVDGVVSMPQSNTASFIPLYREKNIPLVFIDQRPENAACDCVLVNNIQAAQMATDHLLRCGHRNIGILCGSATLFTAKERAEGYRRAFALRGLPVREENLRFCGYTFEDAARTTAELMSRPDRPTALLATSYDLTIGAITTLQDLQLAIGRDVSLIGFDSMELAQVFRPKLTTVTQPMEEIGQNAARLLMRRLQGDCENFPCEERLPTDLTVGDSVCLLQA